MLLSEYLKIHKMKTRQISEESGVPMRVIRAIVGANPEGRFPRLKQAVSLEEATRHTVTAREVYYEALHGEAARRLGIAGAVSAARAAGER